MLQGFPQDLGILKIRFPELRFMRLLINPGHTPQTQDVELPTQCCSALVSLPAEPSSIGEQSGRYLAHNAGASACIVAVSGTETTSQHSYKTQGMPGL